jgi:hypothetical protein
MEQWNVGELKEAQALNSLNCRGSFVLLGTADSY